MAILMFVTLGFSMVIYAGTMQTARNTIEMHEKRILVRMGNRQGFMDLPAQVHQSLIEDSINEVRHKTITTLAMVNAVILIISGFLAYFLSSKTLSPIEQMLLKQKRFIADAAHELKTPVTAIKTSLEVTLRNKKLNLKEAKDTLAGTIEEIDSLTYLIHSIIKQNRYEDDLEQSDSSKETVNIEKVVNAAITKMTASAAGKEIAIKKNIQKQDLTVKGSFDDLTELLTILIDNAIKFSPKKSEIEINVRESGSTIKIQVMDKGMGILPKDIPYIFDRFYKSDPSRYKSDSNNGFGLGLSIAKEIVNKNKGQISAESNNGKGSIFTVRLPI